MLALLIAAAAATAAPPQLAEAAHAIAAGRLDQARIMVAEAVKAGAAGEPVERVLADLAFANRDDHSAFARYQALLRAHPDEPLLLERAGIAALRLGRSTDGQSLLRRSVARFGGSWSAWNALAVASDRASAWTDSDAAYARAVQLAPDSAQVANNRGWSLMLRGRWTEAASELERAARLDPKSSRIADNLELARIAAREQLPERRAGESDPDWAARLNDAGVVAMRQGDRKRAIAAFSRAVEARSNWYERAANNLAAVQAK